MRDWWGARPDETLTEGAELTHWNGVPIDLDIARNAVGAGATVTVGLGSADLQQARVRVRGSPRAC